MEKDDKFVVVLSLEDIKEIIYDARRNPNKDVESIMQHYERYWDVVSEEKFSDCPENIDWNAEEKFSDKFSDMGCHKDIDFEDQNLLKFKDIMTIYNVKSIITTESGSYENH